MTSISDTHHPTEEKVLRPDTGYQDNSHGIVTTNGAREEGCLARVSTRMRDNPGVLL